MSITCLIKLITHVHIYRTCSQIKTLWAALVFVFKGDKHWVDPKREKKNWPGAV